jgi:hypothetical protein
VETAPVAIVEERSAVGQRCLRFTSAAVIELPGTQKLGPRVTVAAHVRDVPAGHRRLFSAYDGGSTAPREFIVDMDSGGDVDAGRSLRFYYDGKLIGAGIDTTGKWNAGSGEEKVHHIAATWNDGIMKLYFDGAEVAGGGEEGGGSVDLRLGDLRFGEDYPPTDLENEPFLGIADDILVLRRALSASETQEVAEKGAAAALADSSPEEGVLYTMESDTKRLLRSRFGGGDEHAAILPAAGGFAEQELVLNVSTSAAGGVRVEIEDPEGNPLPGYRLQESVELIGDSLARPVAWRRGTDVSHLAGKPLRLRFVMKDADIYSLRFR